MKRLITIAILLLPALIACKESAKDGGSAATSVVLDRDKVNLQVGESTAITATVLPQSLGMGVNWSVLDPAYADVSQDGTITGKAQGVTYVIATSADGAQKAACMVSVNPPVRYTVSIADEEGHPLEAIYGYPGMKMALSAVTSDGEEHRFTWSVEDASAFSITADEGVLTMGAVASADEAFAYDAESFVIVGTEDGFGCRIPVRSSLLKGVRINQVFYPFTATLEADNSYPVYVLYQAEMGPAVIPADKLDVELTNTTDFTIQQVSDSFALITGLETGVSTQLLAGVNGVAEKVVIAEFVIDKVYPIQASLYYTSSSTLTFTWTEGISADDDISKSYTITLYGNAAGTDVVLSYDIDAEHPCWNGNQPRYCFSGLDAGTDYWFKVTDTSEGAVDVVSDLIPARTDDFTIVEPSGDEAEAGDVILAEDFSELYWYADEISRGAGYSPGTSVSLSTYQDRTVASFVGWRGKFPTDGTTDGMLTKYSTAKKKGRISKWAQGHTARLYIGPGYVYLGTPSYTTHVITPKLGRIPAGMSAKIQVTVHASGVKSGQKARIAVQDSGISFSEVGSGTETNKNKLQLDDNYQEFTFTGGFTVLGEFTVTLDGVKQNDRLAFGPGWTNQASTDNQMILSDMTVTILELK